MSAAPPMDLDALSRCVDQGDPAFAKPISALVGCFLSAEGDPIQACQAELAACTGG